MCLLNTDLRSEGFHLVECEKKYSIFNTFIVSIICNSGSLERCEYFVTRLNSDVSSHVDVLRLICP